MVTINTEIVSEDDSQSDVKSDLALKALKEFISLADQLWDRMI